MLDLEGEAHTMLLPHFCDPAASEQQKNRVKLDLIPDELLDGASVVKVADLGDDKVPTPLKSKRLLDDGESERCVRFSQTFTHETHRPILVSAARCLQRRRKLLKSQRRL